jgi:hypothetical protein
MEKVYHYHKHLAICENLASLVYGSIPLINTKLLEQTQMTDVTDG